MMSIAKSHSIAIAVVVYFNCNCIKHSESSFSSGLDLTIISPYTQMGTLRLRELSHLPEVTGAALACKLCQLLHPGLGYMLPSKAIIRAPQTQGKKAE